MSYTPKTWHTGDTVTATDLNNIENGIANAGSALIITDTNGTLDKTYAEICDALDSGVPCFVKYYEDIYNDGYFLIRTVSPITMAYLYGDTYRIYVAASSSSPVSSITGAGTPTLWTYSATSAQSYPVFLRQISTNVASVSASTSRI